MELTDQTIKSAIEILKSADAAISGKQYGKSLWTLATVDLSDAIERLEGLREYCANKAQAQVAQ